MAEKKIIFIYPPVAKACEPPAGIARLSGLLRARGVAVTVLDANLEGLRHLCTSPVTADDTWTRRAVRSADVHLRALTGARGFGNPDRYRRAVFDLNRVLSAAGRPYGVHLGLANYQDDRLAPVRSRDLLQAAREPERNPFFPYFSRRLARLLDDDAPAIVGFSINYLSQALTAFAMAGHLKKIRPAAQLIAGGGLITSWLRRPGWRNPFEGLFTRLTAGAGEDALLDMLQIADDGRTFPPDYDDLSLLPYLSPGFILPYSAAGGCYWNRCSFCPERAERTPYRPLPPPTVIADLKALSARHRPVLIHLLDNALSPALMAAMAAEPPGPSWYGFARITPHLADPAFCRALAKSGCRMLKLGLESGNREVLDRLNKGLDPELAAAALESLHKARIAVYVYLLFGTTEETPAAARETLRFTAAHSRRIGFLNLAIFNLPAYGPEVDGLDTSSFYDGDLSLYRNFDHPAGWDRQKVRRFLDREFKSHPAIAPIVKRDPPFFTSNHAPFFAAAFRRS